jgi:hypothetical protein
VDGNAVAQWRGIRIPLQKCFYIEADNGVTIVRQPLRELLVWSPEPEVIAKEKNSGSWFQLSMSGIEVQRLALQLGIARTIARMRARTGKRRQRRE